MLEKLFEYRSTCNVIRRIKMRFACSISMIMYTVGVMEGSSRVLPITSARLNPMYIASDTLTHTK